MGAAGSWSTSNELKAQVQRLWERGELLRALLADGEHRFPLRLALAVPTAAEVADRFEAVRGWIVELASMPHLRIEWREVNHRVLGRQRLPQSVWLDTVDAALALIGKRAESVRFGQLVETTRAQQPALLPWVDKRPLRVLELADAWTRLLAVVGWLQAHPRPGVYPRQIDIAGVHSKFIEAHRGVLSEWFELALPPYAIDADHSGAEGFNARYGLLDKPARIRFRVLDPGLALLAGAPLPDITLDADSFAALELPLQRVFITENETNFLAFPATPRSIVMFGAGYGWDAHAGARWLHHCPIHYWGDIDTHGFAILDQLRSRFAHAESFLMDRATLFAHERFWGQESRPVLHDLPRLDAQERALFDDLRDNRLARRLRLEQEVVGFDWMKRTLASVLQA